MLDLARDPKIVEMPGMVSFLASLATPEDRSILRALAKNPALSRFPPDVIDCLMSYDDTRDAILERDDLDWNSQGLAPYIRLTSAETRKMLAGSPEISLYLAYTLAQDPDPEVKHILASNTSVPSPVVQMLRSQEATKQSRGWVELKRFGPRAYYYLRWREGGKLKSKYLGKPS